MPSCFSKISVWAIGSWRAEHEKPYGFALYDVRFSVELQHHFVTVYLEFVGFSMVAISSMMIAYQVSKFILEVPTGYIADRFGRKTSGLVGVVGMLGYYAALLFARSPLLLIGAFALKGFAVACVSGSIEAIYIDSVSQDQLVRLNVVERFVFYASYAISACVGGFISSVGAYLIGLSADIIAMVLTLVVVACIPEMRRGDTAATPKRGISPKMIGAAIARNGIYVQRSSWTALRHLLLSPWKTFSHCCLRVAE